MQVEYKYAWTDIKEMVPTPVRILHVSEQT